jgi:hypothetical protein
MFYELDADQIDKLFRTIWSLAFDRAYGESPIKVPDEVKADLREIVRLCGEAGTLRYAIRAKYRDHDEPLWLIDDDSGDEGRGFAAFDPRYLVTCTTSEEAKSRIKWMSRHSEHVRFEVVPVVEKREKAADSQA